MTPRDRLLGLTVIVLWGLNFLAIRVGLDHFPPFFFAALRFLIIAIPVVIFVPRPQVPLRWLLLYGFGFGFGQFVFLFWAMHSGMPTGLASLVLQSSAPFTVLLGAFLLREKLSVWQVSGIAVAVGGMSLIGWDRSHHAALLPVILTLLGGLSWAFGNLGSRLAAANTVGEPAPMRLMLWMCVIPPLPMLALSAVVEGPTVGWHALGTAFSADAWPSLVGLATSFCSAPSPDPGSGRYSWAAIPPAWWRRSPCWCQSWESARPGCSCTRIRARCHWSGRSS